MADLEKVKKGLDLCLTGEPARCKDCPYDAECKEASGIGPSPLRRDALELLKEKEIGYREKSDALLKMWMDNDITDGEYGKIMNRLNKKTLNKKVKNDG